MCFSMWFPFLRILQCQPKDEVMTVGFEEYSKPLRDDCLWMKDLEKIKRPHGPRFPDGSINWQCPCMAGGSLVAHRCGHDFRKLYVCMSENENDDVTLKCPDQFIDWSACMQNLPGMSRDEIIVLTKNDAVLPVSVHLRAYLNVPDSTPSSFLEDGRINIDCPCMHSALAHRCGYLMRDVIKCFNASEEKPRGFDCDQQFLRYDDCMEKSGHKKN